MERDIQARNPAPTPHLGLGGVELMHGKKCQTLLQYGSKQTSPKFLRK